MAESAAAFPDLWNVDDFPVQGPTYEARRMADITAIHSGQADIEKRAADMQKVATSRGSESERYVDLLRKHQVKAIDRYEATYGPLPIPLSLSNWPVLHPVARVGDTEIFAAVLDESSRLITLKRVKRGWIAACDHRHADPASPMHALRLAMEEARLSMMLEQGKFRKRTTLEEVSV